MKEVGRATNASQKDSNFRLEEKLRDTNNWRGELQGEMDSLISETDLLLESRYQLQSSIEQTQRPLRVTTACLIAREERRAGDRVRDQVEVTLEKEVDIIDFLGANDLKQKRQVDPTPAQRPLDPPEFSKVDTPFQT